MNVKLNNGLEIPQIGVGTWTLRGETARQNVRQALEAGFRHIDTAQGYENETEVGQGDQRLDAGIRLSDVALPPRLFPCRRCQRAVHHRGARQECRYCHHLRCGGLAG